MTEGALKVGVFKFSLLATLPVVILVSLATNQKVQEEKMISTFETLVKRHQEAVVAKANQRKHDAGMVTCPNFLDLVQVIYPQP